MCAKVVIYPLKCLASYTSFYVLYDIGEIQLSLLQDKFNVDYHQIRSYRPVVPLNFLNCQLCEVVKDIFMHTGIQCGMFYFVFHLWTLRLCKPLFIAKTIRH